MRRCPRCDNSESYRIESVNRYVCKNCQHQYSDKSNTIFHRSKLPMEKLNKFIDLVKEGKNILQISKLLGIQYKSAHRIYYRITNGTMGN